MEKIKKLTKKVKNWIKKNPKEFWAITIILLVSALLRLYRIDEFMTFLGDEGRDVIVVRRLLTSFDLILVGPGTSIGNMYLGPLYYYMMAPALFLANFSPVGPAVMVALLGVATVFLVWFVAREWFGEVAGVVASSLYAVSPTVIIYSRSSWNPNIMPFFAILAIYAAWNFWRKKDFGWIIVAGVSFAFMLQSHYLALLVGPVLGLFWLLTARDVWKKKERGSFIKNSIISVILLSVLMSPLVIFDARHGWRNFSAMQEFFTKRQTTVSARPWTAFPDMWPLFKEASERLAAGRDELAGKWTAIVLVLGSLFLSFKYFVKRKKDERFFALSLIFVWLIVAFIGLGVYKQEIYDHYYGFFFPAPFILAGALIGEFYKKRKLLAALLVSGLLVVNLTNSPVAEEPNRQYERSIVVANKIMEESGGEPFNLAVIAERNYEAAYKYILFQKNAPIVDIDPQEADETITNQLFVVCELPREKCEPVSNPKAEVANFGWSKIDEEWEVFGTTLFRLIHTQ